MRTCILIAILCPIFASPAFGQSGPAALVATPEGLEARQQSFEKVWRTVKEKHFDPTHGGVDWDKVRQKYEPGVAKSKSDQEFYDLLRQMLGELKQSHFGIIPPGAVPEGTSTEPQTGTAGVEIAWIDGKIVVTRVQGESATRAGVRPGYILRQVGQTQVDPLLEKYVKSPLSASLRQIYATQAVLSYLDGPPGTEVQVTYLDERDQPRQAAVTREKRRGEMSPAFGNFPSQYTEFEAKRLEGGIGYIRFNIFVVPLMDRIRQAIRSMGDAPGIIIDLRGNPGGVGGMANGIAGVLETRQISLGTMRMRSGHVNFAVFPQKDPYTGPVVVLINAGSASTSEVFAGGMQEIGRVVVVGEQSAGAALPSYFEKLPTGALFQYAIADFKTPSGVLIEGRGVTPDVRVKLDRASLLRGRDAQLDAAVEQIRKRAGSNQSR